MFGKPRHRIIINNVNNENDSDESGQQSWLYENRVTIALLSVWLLCAIAYIGYNYKCVGDACFGWMPCYRRLVAVRDERAEGWNCKKKNVRLCI